MSVQPTQTDETSIAAEPITLTSSVVELEDGPGGAIARIRFGDGSRDYAGPLDDNTIAALREVGE